MSERELVIVYEDREPVIVASGFTSDAHVHDMFAYLSGRESDAWLLHIMGLLPPWWQQVSQVQANNLDLGTLEDTPHEDALARWDDMTTGERRRLRYGWRVVPTGDGGRIYRVLDRYAPIIIPDPDVQLILDEMEVKALGPSLSYPRQLVSA